MMNRSFNLSLSFYAVQIAPIDQATGIEPDAQDRRVFRGGSVAAVAVFTMFFPFMKQREKSRPGDQR